MSNFSDDLWVYGMAVIKAGLRTGSIFRWCWDADMVVMSTADERRALDGVAPGLLASELADQLSVHPEEYAAEVVRMVLDKADPEVKMACLLLLQGQTFAEIADQIGVTERTIDGQFYWLPKRVTDLGGELRARRVARKLTISTVAAQIGCSKAKLSRLERGAVARRRPTFASSAACSPSRPMSAAPGLRWPAPLTGAQRSPT